MLDHGDGTWENEADEEDEEVGRVVIGFGVAFSQARYAVGGIQGYGAQSAGG
jgi:hypothetical protein